MIDQNVSQLTIVMWLIVFLSIASAYDQNYNLNYREIDSNYETNKINKGIWRRHKHQDTVPLHSETFFFRPMSNEESFTPNLQDLTFLTRDKRASVGKIRKRHTKNVKTQAKTEDDKRSIFNDLPVEIAMILDNTKDVNIGYTAYPRPKTTETIDASDKTDPKDNSIIDDEILNDVSKSSEGNTTTKRSMKYDEPLVDKLNFLEFYNKTNKIQKSNEDQIWQQTPVVTNVFQIPRKDPKNEADHRKSITESGLIKVLSMLTKTFKKIVKQHNSIKAIHSKMSNISKNFEQNTEIAKKKFNYFETKYDNIMKVVNKLKNFQECLKNKEEMYKLKEDSLAQNLRDFESQQKKFLAQQQQFYNIQKMMLAQNDKINTKQNAIAKMQNEISHKQNYFAAILKQAKQNMPNRFPKFKMGMLKFKPNLERINETGETTSTQRSTSVEPVTINLFSIAKNNVIQNHDKMLLNEKDEKSVDDLIYKYYFNNTFLDTVIRNQILGGILITDKTNIARNDKYASKKDEDPKKNGAELKYTIMVPVESKTSFKRERRWINHHSKRKHGKALDSKGPHGNLKNVKTTTNMPQTTKIVKESDVIAKDPFVVMATSFCKGIGQSTTQQILNWCVEKSIRRLRNLDMKMMPPPVPKVVPQLKANDKDMKSTLRPVSTNAPSINKGPVPVTPVNANPASKAFISKQNAARKLSIYYPQFFPGNEELEANLKQFDLTPDTAGNVYYDGSLHASALLGDQDSVSDILPGFDSNSKIDLDTKALKLQMNRKYIQSKIQRMRKL